jgi:hypothetical protein
MIDHENPEELVLEDRAQGPKLIVAAGTGVAVLFAIFARDLDLFPRVFPVIVMLGVSTFVFSSRREVFHFDRTAGLLSVHLREPRGLTTTRTIPFSEIQDVQVEALPAAGGVVVRYNLVPLHSVQRVDFRGDPSLGLSEGLLRSAVTNRFGAYPPVGRAAEAL